MKRYMVTAAAAALLGLTAASAHAEIKIATAGPMTGQYASFGEQMQKGAQAAVRDINAAGGVLGQQLVLSVGDDRCDPKEAVAVANKFVNDGIKFVAGHFCSGSSIPASAVYNEEGILQMSRDCQEFRVWPGLLNISGGSPVEAFLEEHGELGLCHVPLTSWHGPFFLGPVQDQEQ